MKFSKELDKKRKNGYRISKKVNRFSYPVYIGEEERKRLKLTKIAEGDAAFNKLLYLYRNYVNSNSNSISKEALEEEMDAHRRLRK
jgi:hypothetical protein